MRRFINSKTQAHAFKINNQFAKQPNKVFQWSLAIFVVLLVVIGFIVLDQKWAEMFSSFPAFFEQISKMFKWNFTEYAYVNPSTGDSFLDLAFNSVVVTISMAFAGTIIGVILAIPVAILASSNIIVVKWINNTARAIVALFRTVPSFTYALILVGYFGESTFTVTIALAIFTFSITTKMLYEKIEHINARIFVAMQATGANKIRSFKAGVVPQISNHIISTIFYALETNIRYISIIGAVTHTGIGSLIEKYNSQANQDDKVGFLLMLLVSIVLILELIIYLLRKYIIFDKDYFLDQKQQAFLNKQLKKRLFKSDVRFYLDEVVLKTLHEKLQTAIKQDDQKTISALRQEIKLTTKDFMKQHQAKLKEERTHYKLLKASGVDHQKLFSFDQQLSSDIRIDKLYLTKFKTEILFIKSEIKTTHKHLANQAHEEYVGNLNVNVVKKQQPHQYLKRWIVYIALFALFCYSISLVHIDWQNSATIASTNKKLLGIFKIEWGSLFGVSGHAPYSVISLILETLSIAIVSTFIGAIIAYILGLLSSENIVNFYVAKIFVAITTIIRSIPTYIYAFLFIALVGLGTFNATLAIIMGSIGMLTKYNREIFDDINMKLVTQLKATGASWIAIFKYGVVVQTNSNIFAYVIYRFDINFKEVITLGAVGAGNLGFLLNSYFHDQYYAEFGALLLGIIIFSLCLESITTILRNKINNNLNPKWIDKLILWSKHYNFAKYKANEELRFKHQHFTYEAAAAFYTYANQMIIKQTQVLKHTNHMSFKQAYYQAYCDFFNLEVVNYNYKQAYAQSCQTMQQQTQHWRQKRKQFLWTTKHETKLLNHQLKRQLAHTNNPQEIKKAIQFNKLSYKIQAQSLDY